MHWHARVARSVVLALTLLMTQTTRYACVAALLHIHKCLSESHDQGRVPVRKKITLETRQINTMVGPGGRLLRSRPSARLAAPTDGFDPFL